MRAEFIFWLFLVAASSSVVYALSSLLYSEARNVRLQHGHEAARKLYLECLERSNHADKTAATRIAVSPFTPERHDAACPLNDTSNYIRQLQFLLRNSDYTTESIQVLLNIPKEKWASAPIYVQPCRAGDTRVVAPRVVAPRVVSIASQESSLQCLVMLFLLGMSVSRETLSSCLLGGSQSIDVLEQLGLAFPCSVDRSLIVPYVHIMPLLVNRQTLWLVTDLHPNVLSTTTVGTHNHGAVMYIGPDSLALVQHMVGWIVREEWRGDRLHNNILDLCTGSGIQALAMLSLFSDAQAMCVDVNERALQFVKFNAALNGMSDRVQVLQGDLIHNTCIMNGHDKVDLLEGIKITMGQTLYDDYKDGAPFFDLILANPPFIPVPPGDGLILQRYGLFSSGGASGEEVLESIIKLASRLICKSGGLLAIVSEFMNPPRHDTDNVDDEELLVRLQAWWVESKHDTSATGILFTNEVPVEADLYAARRADSISEKELWERHLATLLISHVSPGLLFVWTTENQDEPSSITIHHRLVPRSSSGSVWTPSNCEAVEFTKSLIAPLIVNQS